MKVIVIGEKKGKLYSATREVTDKLKNYIEVRAFTEDKEFYFYVHKHAWNVSKKERASIVKSKIPNAVRFMWKKRNAWLSYYF